MRFRRAQPLCLQVLSLRLAHRRSAIDYGWHITPDYVLCDHGVTVGHAYTQADAVRWVDEGVLP